MKSVGGIKAPVKTSQISNSREYRTDVMKRVETLLLQLPEGKYYAKVANAETPPTDPSILRNLERGGAKVEIFRDDGKTGTKGWVFKTAVKSTAGDVPIATLDADYRRSPEAIDDLKFFEQQLTKELSAGQK